MRSPLGVIIIQTDMMKDRLSSDNLYHFKSDIGVLNAILTHGFRHTLWPENIPYKNSRQLNFMSCFCDIRIEDSKYHQSVYGDNAIVLTKEWGLKNGVNPVRYVTENSPGLSQEYMGTKNRYRTIRKISNDNIDTLIMQYSTFAVLKDENKLTYDSAEEEFVQNSNITNEIDNLEAEFVALFDQLKGTSHGKSLIKFMRSLANRVGDLHNELEKRDSLMRAYMEDFTHPATNKTIKNKVLYDEREWRSIRYPDFNDNVKANSDKFLPENYNLLFGDDDILAILLKDQASLDIVKNYITNNKTLLDSTKAVNKLSLIDSFTEK
jgi:hypothetical protein